MLRILKSDLTYSLIAGFLAGAAVLHFTVQPVDPGATAAADTSNLSMETPSGSS